MGRCQASSNTGAEHEVATSVAVPGTDDGASTRDYCRPGTVSNMGSFAACSYHRAPEAKKILRSGLTPGSPSRPPAGTSTHLPFLVVHGRADPHRVHQQVEYDLAPGS